MIFESFELLPCQVTSKTKNWNLISFSVIQKYKNILIFNLVNVTNHRSHPPPTTTFAAYAQPLSLYQSRVAALERCRIGKRREETAVRGLGWREMEISFVDLSIRFNFILSKVYYLIDAINFNLISYTLRSKFLTYMAQKLCE